MAEISKAGVDPSALHSTAPRMRPNLTAQQAADMAAQDTMNDQVELGTQGQDAGLQTGLAQNLAAQARRLGTTRDALAAGGIQAGDVAPGEDPNAAADAAPAQPQATPPAAAQPAPEATDGGNAADAAAAQPADDPAPAPTPDPSNPTGGTGTGTTPASGGPQTQAATAAQAAQNDAQSANTIWMQMAADRQKWMMQMWQIWQDTQTAIMQIIQQVALNRAQVEEKMMAAWDSLITGNPAS